MTRPLALASALVSALLFSAPSPAAAGPDLVFVLDASGSMWGQIDGVAKIETARTVLSGLLEDLPEDARIGLVSYGDQREGDCEDVTVVSALGELPSKAVAERLGGIQPKGKTPVAFSLERAGELFGERGGGQIVLVSDGIETCGGDPCATAEALAGRGVDLRIHVVGFDVDEETREQLECVAEKGSGRYFDARDVEGFEAAIAEVKEEVEAAPLVTITHPGDGADVPRFFGLEGTYRNLPPGSTLWRFNFPPLARMYWLGPVHSTANRWWAQHSVGRPGTDDVGYENRVGIVIADEEGTAALQENASRLDELPDGVEIATEIKVRRIDDDLLKAYWSFDACDAKEWAHRHHGTVNGDPECVDGVSGSALRLDGDGDFVQIDDAAVGDLRGDATLAFWMKPESAAGRVLEKDKGQFWVVTFAEGRPVLHLRDKDRLGEPEVTLPLSPPDFEENVLERWSFVAIVKEGTELSTYFDAELVVAEDTEMISIATTAPMTLGRSDYWEGEYFTGLVDEVRLYDKALELTEIQDLYRLSSVYWKREGVGAP